MAQGKELAAARREALAALIQIDPKHALELAAPWKWREELPPEIASLLEQRVSGRGKYSVFDAVPLAGQNEFVGPILRYATLDSVAYRAFVYGRRLHQISQAELTLHGIAINDALAVHEDPVRVLEPEEAQAILAKGGPVEDPICSVSGLPTQVVGQPTVVAYDRDIVRFVTVPGFNFGGLAYVGASGVWLQSSGLGVVCHELGHNGDAVAYYTDTCRRSLIPVPRFFSGSHPQCALPLLFPASPLPCTGAFL